MSAWKHLSFLFTACLYYACAELDQYKLPDFVEVCYRDDPKIADCIRRNIERFPTIMTSNKRSDLKVLGLQPIDRIPFTDLNFDYKSPLIGGNMICTGTLNGLSNFQVIDVRAKVKNQKRVILDFDLHFPDLNIKSAYTMLGNVIALPVNINGNTDVHYENSNVTFHLAADVKEVEGREHLNLTNFSFNFIGFGVGNVYLANDDVVQGYPGLNRLIKNIVTSSWRQLHTHATPAIIREVAPLIKGRFYKFIEKYPYDVILPKSQPSSLHNRRSLHP